MSRSEWASCFGLARKTRSFSSAGADASIMSHIEETSIRRSKVSSRFQLPRFWSTKLLQATAPGDTLGDVFGAFFREVAAVVRGRDLDILVSQASVEVIVDRR